MNKLIPILIIIFLATPAICQNIPPVRHLVATRGAQKKIFKTKSRVLVNTATQKVKGYAEAVGNDSIAVYVTRTDHERFTKVAIADIVSVRRLQTNGRVIAAVGVIVGFSLIAANGQRVGERSSDFKDAMVGIGVGTMVVCAVAIPVSFVIEKSGEKNMAAGWKLTVE